MGPENDSEDIFSIDIFELLESRDRALRLPAHVKYIVRELGYTCLRTFEELNEAKLDIMQAEVRTRFASKTRLDALSNASKLKVFGSFHAMEPALFEFSSGERNGILLSVAAAKQILRVYDKEKGRKTVGTKRSNPQMDPNATRAAKARRTETLNVDENQMGPRKSLNDYITNWFKNTKMKLIDYNEEHFEVLQESLQVKCKKCCTAPVKVTLTKEGRWKISNFTTHISKYHRGISFCINLPLS
jgi:hypothetical protein